MQLARRARIVARSVFRSPQIIAAIDLGSNSFHMIVARVVDDQLHVLDRLQEMVRLAAGLDDRNRLDKTAQQRALACLERFGQRLRGLAAGDVRVVGTNTLRRARNAGKFLAHAEDALGHRIEVISGQEEARLIYQGVARNLPEARERRLVLDIGGGSTELIIGQGSEPLHLESLHMGCVGVTREYFRNGALGKQAMARALTAAHLELQPIAAQFRSVGWQTALGASGTVRAVAAVVREQGFAPAGIPAAALARLRDMLVATGRMERLALPGLSAERVPIFPGGVAILSAVFEALKIDHMEVADGALREGLLYDLVGRLGRQDVRGRTIAALSVRYLVDVAQTLRIERAARHALEQVRAAWALHEDDALALGWAARLHEIGLGIAHTKYHKHGAYLVEHSELPGFSYQERRLLAALIRGHRRRFPVEVFDALPRAQAQSARRVCVLLRLAVLLHRARTDVEPPAFQLRANRHALHLRFARGWLKRHPLTRADLEQETVYLRAAGFRLAYV